MSLSDLASLGSFVSGVAVLVSLVFLYFQLREMASQVRQGERNQMASIRHGRTSRTVELFVAAADPSIANAIEKVGSGIDEITTGELRQFRNFFIAYYNHAEDSFYQHRDGLLDDEAFDLLVYGLTSSLRSPGYRAAWRQMFARRMDDFAVFIKKIVDETSVLEQGDALSDWKRALSKVRAAPLPQDSPR